MYADPYLITIVNRVEIEQRAALLERARIAEEHPERLVLRRRGRTTGMLRLLRRIVPGRSRRAAKTA